MSAEVVGWMVVQPGMVQRLFCHQDVAEAVAEVSGQQAEPLVRAINLVGAETRLMDVKIALLMANLEIAKRDHRIAKLEGEVETLECIRSAACA